MTLIGKSYVPWVIFEKMFQKNPYVGIYKKFEQSIPYDS